MQRRSDTFRKGVWFLLTLMLLLVPAAAGAQSKTLYWEQYHTDITVETNGDLMVQELQTIAFTSGTFTYGYRTIPLGKTEGIDDVQVWEGNRQYAPSTSQESYTFSVREQSGELVVYWYFPATTGSQRSFNFRYSVRAAIRMDERQGDSLFWKAIPPDHAFPIRDARVTVRFPAGVEFGDIVSYGGKAVSSIEGNTVSFVASEPLSAGEELEIGIAVAPGIVQAEAPRWQQREEQRAIWNLVLGALGAVVLTGGLVGVILLWYRRGRDPEVGLVAELLSEPPSEAPPGVVGTLLDERADIKDVLASLVDLGRRGYLDMIESQVSRGLLGLGRGSEFTFRRTGKPWDDLAAFERTILDRVFKGSAEKSLDSLRNQFYSALPDIKHGLYQQSVQYGFFRSSPESVRQKFAAAGAGLLILTVGAGIAASVLLAQTASAVICPFVAVGIVAVALIIAGQAMPVKTRLGAEHAARWRAFRRYLQEIERHSKLEEATDRFDRFLPYAVAFGLERSWINKFAAVPATPIPHWYYPAWIAARPSGGNDLRPTGGGGRGIPSLDAMSRGMATGLSSMSAGLVAMLNTASSAMVSQPQSSGGGGRGGWSGGGFSSGGGGGGGSAGFG